MMEGSRAVQGLDSGAPLGLGNLVDRVTHRFRGGLMNSGPPGLVFGLMDSGTY